jgi:hypothetical protein
MAKAAPTLDRIASKMPENPTTEFLLEVAKYLYTSSLQKVALRTIADHPSFRGRIHLRTLERYCDTEQWIEIRRQNAEAWRKALTEETGRELVETRKKMLKQVRQVVQNIFKKLLPDKNGNFKFEIHSYESLVQAWAKLIDRQDLLTQNVLDEIMPDVRPSTTPDTATEKTEAALKPETTPEEARAGAKAIMAYRRRMQNQLAGRPTEDEDDDDED